MRQQKLNQTAESIRIQNPKLAVRENSLSGATRRTCPREIGEHDRKQSTCIGVILFIEAHERPHYDQTLNVRSEEADMSIDACERVIVLPDRI